MAGNDTHNNSIALENGKGETARVFGEPLPLTKKHRIRLPTLRALLKRRPDLTITVYRVFDAMTDGSRLVDLQVTRDWLRANVLDVHSTTMLISIERSLGAPNIDISNAVYGVTIWDAEYARRQELAGTLPSHDVSGDSAIFLSNGSQLSVGRILQARRELLGTFDDPFAFDETVELLRQMTALDELAVYLSERRHLPDILNVDPLRRATPL